MVCATKFGGNSTLHIQYSSRRKLPRDALPHPV